MKEIVQSILKEEENARKKIEQARRQAEDLLQNAKTQAQQIAGEIIASARESSIRKEREDEKRLLDEKENILEKTRGEAQTVIEEKKQGVPHMAEQVFNEILDSAG